MAAIQAIAARHYTHFVDLRRGVDRAQWLASDQLHELRANLEDPRVRRRFTDILLVRREG